MESEHTTEQPLPSIGSSRKPFRPGRLFLFFLITSAALALDLSTKHILFGQLGLPTGRVSWVIDNVFGFQTSLNEGALWGMGAGQIPLFVIASFAALLGVGFWYKIEAAKSWIVVISLALITSGILGNLWDRLALHGLRWPEGVGPELAGQPIHAVRDWILVLIGSYHWPNFNIADSALVAGTILMIFHILFKKDKIS